MTELLISIELLTKGLRAIRKGEDGLGGSGYGARLDPNPHDNRKAIYFSYGGFFTPSASGALERGARKGTNWTHSRLFPKPQPQGRPPIS